MCRNRCVGVLIALSVMTFCCQRPADAQDKPNIVVIMGDDVGWMNVSAYGGDIMGVRTPNIDRIGREGIRFTSFYLSQAVLPDVQRLSPVSFPYVRA